jgi:ornithine cyclodeaminase/alanine dehydrogenase-like protein (mu-crystallin family)
MTRILTRADLASLLTPDDCLRAVETVFRDRGEGRIAAPSTLGVYAGQGSFHVKAAAGELFAAKINANFPGNPKKNGLPSIQGVLALFDIERGTPLALLDSAAITTLRTAAATAVAAKYLARADASIVLLVGCGTQGRATLEALRLVRPIRRVLAFDLDADAAARLARDLSPRLGIDIAAVPSIDDAIAGAGIVVTCTPSRTPILDARHLHAGLFVAAVGADHPEKQELTPALLRASRVVADDLEQAAAMGDLHHALASGAMTRADVHGELAQVLCGHVPARTSDDEIFVFDSTGTALQDLATATLAFHRAEERGLGIEVNFTREM